MMVAEALAERLAELLRSDPRRVVLGEDVRDGGMLGLSRRIVADAALCDRALATPLVPASLIAHAAGLAIGGHPAIVLLHSSSALLEGMAALREAARIPWQSAGAHAMPLTIVAPTGPGFGLGSEQAAVHEAALASVPGLRVAVVSLPEQAVSMLDAAVDFTHDSEPVVLLLPRSIVLAERDEPLRHEPVTPVGVAQVVRDGSRVTVLAWGDTVLPALAAVRELGVDASVVDVRSLAPIDVDTIVNVARTSGRIVIAHSGGPRHGIGAELAALLADQVILHLDGPIVRITGAERPCAPGTESLATPSQQQIADAIERVATY